MKTGWLDRAGDYRIEHLPCPRPGQRVDLRAPAKGILHTTEGSFESALTVFRQHFAPTFMVGRDKLGRVRILQMVPLGEMAAALENHPGGVETNRVCRVQIEIVGFSKKTTWLPDSGVTAALAALMRTLENAAEIPLQHIPVARDTRKWSRVAGWLGHIDVPENTHWDAGAINYQALFKLAEAGHKPVPKLKERARLRDRARFVLRYRNGIPMTEPLCPKEAR